MRPGDTNQECQGNSLWVEFENCEGGFLTNEKIEIVDGTFHLLNEQGGLAGYWDIRGTFRRQRGIGSRHSWGAS